MQSKTGLSEKTVRKVLFADALRVEYWFSLTNRLKAWLWFAYAKSIHNIHTRKNFYIFLHIYASQNRVVFQHWFQL